MSAGGLLQERPAEHDALTSGSRSRFEQLHRGDEICAQGWPDSFERSIAPDFPRQMDDDVRAHRAHNVGDRSRLGEIADDPAQSVVVRPGSAAHSNDVDPPVERAQHVAADQAACARDEYAVHTEWSGQAWSRSEISRFSATGHSIPKAGSSQRTPRADSGTYSWDIW